MSQGILQVRLANFPVCRRLTEAFAERAGPNTATGWQSDRGRLLKCRRIAPDSLEADVSAATRSLCSRNRRAEVLSTVCGAKRSPESTCGIRGMTMRRSRRDTGRQSAARPGTPRPSARLELLRAAENGFQASARCVATSKPVLLTGYVPHSYG